MATTSKHFSLLWALLGFIAGAILAAVVVKSMQNDTAESTQAALFSYDGKAYEAQQLPAPLARQLYDLNSEVYNHQRELLQQAAMEIHIEREAEQRKISPEQVAVELLDVAAPTEQEIAQFYAENESRINAPLDQVQGQIAQFITQQRRLEKQQQVIDQLQQDKRLEIHLTPPASPEVNIDTSGRPSKGEPNAAVTVVEFADYQCPHCKTASATLDKLVEEHPDRVQLIYLDFPVNSSGISRRVAHGSFCADQQGQFWPYNGLAFRNQDRLSQGSPLDFARELNLDLSAFESCLDSEEARQWVATSERQAIELGIRGTPAIFINGQRFHGHDLEQSLERAVLDAAKTGSGRR